MTNLCIWQTHQQQHHKATPGASSSMASHAAPARTRSPGRARCQLNYPRREQVVQVEVLPQVKEARRDYEQHYSADVLGVRGPQVRCLQAQLSTCMADAGSAQKPSSCTPAPCNPCVYTS